MMTMTMTMMTTTVPLLLLQAAVSLHGWDASTLDAVADGLPATLSVGSPNSSSSFGISPRRCHSPAPAAPVAAGAGVVAEPVCEACCSHQGSRPTKV